MNSMQVWSLYDNLGQECGAKINLWSMNGQLVGSMLYECLELDPLTFPNVDNYRLSQIVYMTVIIMPSHFACI